MFLVIEPEKQEEDYIDIWVYKIDFTYGPTEAPQVSRNIYCETVQNIYLFTDSSGVEFWFEKYFSKDFIDSHVPDFDTKDRVCMEYNYSTKEFRII